jgi:hypothetical protein
VGGYDNRLRSLHELYSIGNNANYYLRILEVIGIEVTMVMNSPGAPLAGSIVCRRLYYCNDVIAYSFRWLTCTLLPQNLDRVLRRSMHIITLLTLEPGRIEMLIFQLRLVGPRGV